MGSKRYRVEIAETGKCDVKEKKKYILEHFKYREYAEKFSKKIKKAAEQLEIFPTGNEKTGFQYRGYDIFIKSQNNHLLFYTVNEETATVTVLRVLPDERNWQSIIKRWIRQISYIIADISFIIFEEFSKIYCLLYSLRINKIRNEPQPLIYTIIQ